jgi:hypothetical protein
LKLNTAVVVPLAIEPVRDARALTVPEVVIGNAPV